MEEASSFFELRLTCTLPAHAQAFCPGVLVLQAGADELAHLPFPSAAFLPPGCLKSRAPAIGLAEPPDPSSPKSS
jgi:hypothetical protein